MDIKLNAVLDQHDIIGLGIIVIGSVFVALKFIDGATYLGVLGIAAGLILGSNVPILSGKTNG
jgi:hypothetical protein